jgi:hypothetical protein
MSGEPKPDGVVDLLGPMGTGPPWGMASAELNATLLAWPPGHEVVDDTASVLEVLLIVLQGGGTAKVDDREHELPPRQCASGGERSNAGDPGRRRGASLSVRAQTPRTTAAHRDPRAAVTARVDDAADG